MGSAADSLYARSLTLRLLTAKNARLVLGFLDEAFKLSGHHQIPEEALELLLDRHLNLAEGSEVEPMSDNRARNYLNLWCSDGYRYLRKVFSPESQSFVYQLTHHSEKALQWLHELQSGERHRGHTTAESRFSRICGELRELSRKTRQNPRERTETLLAERDRIDAEIQRIRDTGTVETLAPEQVKERLIDLEQMVDSFLADFRAIEERFRQQAAEIHEIHLERGRSKGDIVAHALDADEALRASEQGRSYYGFRSLIRSLESREELARHVADAARLAAEQGLDDRVFVTLIDRLLHEVTIVQESYQRIAGQLRRVVDESDSNEHRQLLDWIGAIKQAALAHRDDPPEDEHFTTLEGAIHWNNLMELGLHEPRSRQPFAAMEETPPEDDTDVRDAIRRIGKPLDLARYRQQVASLLESREQIALRELLTHFPPTEGAVDLVGYLCVAQEDERHLIAPEETEDLDLQRPVQPRFARLQRIIFQRT